jgi:hypothetical protein
MVVKTPTVDLREYYEHHLLHLWRQAPFVLRITERKDRPIPVLIVKERQNVSESNGQAPARPGLPDPPPQGNLSELGRLDGAALRRCLPILRQIVGRVRNAHDIPLELQRYLTQGGLKLRLNLPLDEEAGAKLGLIFRLQGRVTDLDRVELMARRLARFTREEAVYWLSRTTSFGSDANRWAIAGLRVMLAGHVKDPAVERMLERLRQTA